MSDDAGNKTLSVEELRIESIRLREESARLLEKSAEQSDRAATLRGRQVMLDKRIRERERREQMRHVNQS